MIIINFDKFTLNFTAQFDYAATAEENKEFSGASNIFSHL